MAGGTGQRPKPETFRGAPSGARGYGCHREHDGRASRSRSKQSGNSKSAHLCVDNGKMVKRAKLGNS